MEKAQNLELATFSPFLSVCFWHSLSKKKLEEYKLDDSEKPITATYKANHFKDIRAHLNFDSSSFSQSVKTIGQVEVKVTGWLKNCNTVEAFDAENKIILFEDKYYFFYDQLKGIAESPEKYPKIPSLNTFFMVTFADLKHNLFKFSLVSPIFETEKVKVSSIRNLKEFWNEKQIERFEISLKENLLKEESIPPVLFAELVEDKFRFFSSPLDFFEAIENSAKNVAAVILDSYNQEDKYGEPVYNFILLILLRKTIGKGSIKAVQIITIKDFFVLNSQAKITWVRSQLLEIDLSKARVPEGKPKILLKDSLKASKKIVDLKTQLDERSLSTMAVDLNIKLMKWRLLPELNIEKVQKTKCLLFGAGTLGCQVSRNLLGWGIRTITFIDYGRVTHSNPVRQSLFDFEDAQNGGKPKAETAALKLAKIFPGVNSRGFSLEIPMPGHFAQSDDKKKIISETLDTLEELVKEHDALFLVTDNRESRWLPTVLANKYNKICITVGLGFDSYVIVRHGVSCTEHKQEVHGKRLGCYFCNDILSPQNSMKNRTLDQQCTVTRPGLSFISSGFACELLVALLHHPLGVGAPSFDPEVTKNEETCFGVLPHFLRGSCSEYDSKIFVSEAFSNCVACSDYVLKEFCDDRNAFVYGVMNDPNYLQDVTKIADVLKETEEGECLIIEDDTL